MAVRVGRVRMLVKALRSGKYEQGKYLLKIDASGEAPAKYCCLGVAHEVHKAATGEEFDGGCATLSHSARDWYGFDTTDPKLGPVEIDDDGVPSGVGRATTWNDNYGKTFLEIADAFENTYIKKTPATAGVTTEGSHID